MAKNLKYDGCQRGLTLTVYKYFDKKASAMRTRSKILATWNKFAGGVVKSEIMPNRDLAQELQKPIIRKLEKIKLYSSFKDNIWGAEPTDLQLISKFNKGTCLKLCVIVIYST